jgi:hypothetical protein
MRIEINIHSSYAFLLLPPIPHVPSLLPDAADSCVPGVATCPSTIAGFARPRRAEDVISCAAKPRMFFRHSPPIPVLFLFRFRFRFTSRTTSRSDMTIGDVIDCTVTQTLTYWRSLTRAVTITTSGQPSHRVARLSTTPIADPPTEIQSDRAARSAVDPSEGLMRMLVGLAHIQQLAMTTEAGLWN